MSDEAGKADDGIAGAFDCVLCGFALWFFPHPDCALQQFYRVLKPGGRLALTTWTHDSPMHNLQRDTLRPHLIPPSPLALRRSRDLTQRSNWSWHCGRRDS